MARERMSWQPVGAWAMLNARLRRLWEVAESSTRVDVQRVDASMVVNVSWPHQLYLVTTGVDTITLTLPPAADVVGYELRFKKLLASGTVTITAAPGETIDGSGSAANLTARYAKLTIVSDGATWHEV